MTTFDFEADFDRTGTNSVKWEFRVGEAGIEAWDRTDAALGNDRVLPMWVADMDFAAAPPIVEALHARVEHGVFGYGMRGQSYIDAVVGWMTRRQGWHVDPDWIVPTTGVVPAIHLVVRRFTERGDKVLIQRPVYHPFSFAAINNGREVVANSLVLDDGRYRMDFESLKRQVSDPKVKLALLCSPHNPVGRIWTPEEVTQFASICIEHDVLVVADEIHGDLVLPGHRFTPIGALDRSIFERAIICTAPSKTFNLAGLKTANAIIPDAATRAALVEEIRATGLYSMSPLGIAGLEAAYNHGEQWLDAAIDRISQNMHRLADACEGWPSISMIEPEGTYLAWLDCRGLELDDAALGALVLDDARILVDEGHIFGPEGSGFIRINVACSKSLLDEAIARLDLAFTGR